MKIEEFNTVITTQIGVCYSYLTKKGEEYAPGAKKERAPYSSKVESTGSEDRLAHFKKAAAIMNTTPKAALLGMLSKHIVSVSDMCLDNKSYPLAKWDEKITDSINYLLILRAIVEEEQHGQN